MTYLKTSTDVTKSRLPTQLEWKFYLLKITERYPVALLTPATQSNLDFSPQWNVTQYSMVLPAALKADTCQAYYLRGPGSIAGELIWDLWWKKWYWVSFGWLRLYPVNYHTINASYSLLLSGNVLYNVFISGRSSTQMLSHSTIRITLCYAWLTVILRWIKQVFSSELILFS